MTSRACSTSPGTQVVADVPNGATRVKSYQDGLTRKAVKSPCECELYRGPTFIEQCTITNGWHFHASHLLTFKTIIMNGELPGFSSEEAGAFAFHNESRLMKNKDYSAMAAMLRELDNLLPESTRPWEVAQIALEFADYCNETKSYREWYADAQEYEKVDAFLYFLKNEYGKHQSDPLDDEDH